MVKLKHADCIDSMEHAREDIESAHADREQRVEAKRVIEAIDSALATDGEQLLSAEGTSPQSWRRVTRLFWQDKHETATTAELKQLIRDRGGMPVNFTWRGSMDSSVKRAAGG